MIIIFLNVLALLAYIAGVLYFGMKYLFQKSRAEELEKRLKGNLTDFEKMQFIAELYREIDFDKLRPDQIEVFTNFIEKVNFKFNRNESK